MAKSPALSRVVADANSRLIEMSGSLDLGEAELMCECGHSECQERMRIPAEEFAFLLQESLPILALTHTPPEQSPQEREIDELRETVHQLQRALDSRVLIEQAKGVLAERRAITPTDAFEILRSSSRSQGRKLAEVARELIATTTRGPTA